MRIASGLPFCSRRSLASVPRGFGGELMRGDISREPLPSGAAVVLISAVASLPAVVVNTLVFRRGRRTRGAWLIRGLPTAVFITLTILAVLSGFVGLVRLGMTH